MSFFPQTSWTVIAKAGKGSSLELEAFCRTYRQPIYSFARAKGLSHEDAEDLTQMFFASLLRRNLLETADPTIGRLRNYLLRHFTFVLRDHFKHESTQARGGGVKPQPIVTAFGEIPDSRGTSPSLLTEEVLRDALRELQRNYEANQSTVRFEELRPFLDEVGSLEPASYENLQAKHPEIAPATLRKRVSRLRDELKKLLIARVPELAHYVVKPRRDARQRFESLNNQGDLKPEVIYNREWATCVLENARRLLRQDYNRKYHDVPFKSLECVLRGEDCESICSQFPKLAPEDIQERVEFLKDRFIQLRTAVVGGTVADESDLVDEIRELDSCWMD